MAIPPREGRILEVTDFWDSALEPIVIERDHAKLVGCVTFERGKGREVTVMRVFDYFTGMTGKGGGPGPQQYESEDFRTDTYNTEGQQNGFHRGMDDDEIWFQYRGHATNDTEWGVHELDAGEMGYVPRGIAHRITGDPGFLRYVFYFRHPMYPQVDSSGPGKARRSRWRRFPSRSCPRLPRPRPGRPRTRDGVSMSVDRYFGGLILRFAKSGVLRGGVLDFASLSRLS